MSRAERAPSAAPAPVSERVRRWRGPAAVVALLLGTAIVLGLVQSSMSRGSLDPEGIDARGARALVRLLEAEGVRVSPVRTTADAVEAAGPDDTVLVTVPDLLTPEQVDEVVDTGARLVLVAPQARVGEFAPELAAVRVDAPREVAPECPLPAARRAGSARLGGYGYRGELSRTHGASCYPVDDEPALVVTASAGGGPVTILGSADPLTNEYLDRDGNAALALGLLGQDDHLVWYRPVPEAGGETGVPLTDQLPGWVRAGAWQLAIAVILVAVWRARRLGRLVAEPLPVVVRASETTQGRARLYRRGRSRDHAAALLREASIRRLGSTGPWQLAPAHPGTDTLAETLAQRIGRPAEQISALLYGPPPTDDAGLVRLADDLDALEKEARTS